MWSSEVVTACSQFQRERALVSKVKIHQSQRLVRLPYAYIYSTFEYFRRANELSAHGI